MSRTAHPRRARRADDGRFLPKDAAVWRRLIRCARAVVKDRARNAEAAAAASNKASRAVPPPGFANRESIFLQLVVKARMAFPGWSERPPGWAVELAGLADQCAAVLDAPVVRERKDIEG